MVSSIATKIVYKYTNTVNNIITSSVQTCNIKTLTIQNGIEDLDLGMVLCMLSLENRKRDHLL